MGELSQLGRAANSLLPEGLESFIKQRLELSWNQIARDLWQATDHIIDVSGVTAKTWADQLGIAKAKAS